MKMGINVNVLAESTSDVLLKLLNEGYALYRNQRFGGTDTFHIDLKNSPVCDASPLSQPVNHDDFDELWRCGYLYMTQRLVENDIERTEFALTGTARVIGEAHRNPESRKTLKGKAFLDVLTSLAAGFPLYATEFNMLGHTSEWEVHVRNKAVSRAELVVLLQWGWIDAVGYPKRIQDRRHGWHWTYRISRAGCEALERLEQRTSGTSAPSPEAVRFARLVEQLTELIVEDIGTTQPLAQHKLYFDRLFREVRHAYVQAQIHQVSADAADSP